LKLALVIPGPLDRRSGGYSYDTDLVDFLRLKGHEVEVRSLPESPLFGAKADLVLFDALVHPLVMTELEQERATHPEPWVALVHHLAWLEPAPPNPLADSQKQLERRFLALMDAQIFNSDQTRQTVRDLCGVDKIKPSVVCRPPASGAAPQPFREFSGRLLFLANLIPRKNLHGLITALGLLTRRRPELRWHLTVAGSPLSDPSYAAECRSLAGSLLLDTHIDWVGRLPDDELQQCWHYTDLLAVPSFHEGWGMVYAEALARGIPSLAVRRGGALEVLGKAGLWAEEDSPESLASALELFWDQPDLRRSLGTEALRQAAWLRTETGFGVLPSFLEDLCRWRKQPAPAGLPEDFDAYLEAKVSVDSRSLNPRVKAAAFSGPPPKRVLELGGGTGTMARRLLTEGLITPETNYLLMDQRAEGLAIAQRLAPLFLPGRLTTCQAELHQFLDQGSSQPPDLVVAHALLDLFNPGTTLPGLAKLRAKRYWLTHLFDGLTAWEPVVDPELDRRVVEAYHQSMDQRALTGGEGSSTSGRDWLSALVRHGFSLVEVGSSDWVVHSQKGHYRDDEVLFLRSLLHFFRTSLAGHPGLEAAELSWWLSVREAQITRGEAIFLAHQLDLCAEGPS